MSKSTEKVLTYFIDGPWQLYYYLPVSTFIPIEIWIQYVRRTNFDVIFYRVILSPGKSNSGLSTKPKPEVVMNYVKKGMDFCHLPIRKNIWIMK